MPRTVLIAAFAALLLAGCGGTDASTGAVPIDPNTPLPILTLETSGLGDITFGTDPDDVVNALTPLLGSPSSDTGWIVGGEGIYGSCPDPLRVVSWGSLTTFYDGGPESGGFFAYSYGFDFEEAAAGVDPRGLDLRTLRGIGLDTTAEELAALPDVEFEGDDAIDVWGFSIAPEIEPHLQGQLSGPDPSDTVLFIETSNGCQ